MQGDPIYMDNHATTRCDRRVAETVRSLLVDGYGNAGSTTHRFGEAAREVVATSRAEIARLIGAQPAEIVFTSSATESNNLAIRGLADWPRRTKSHAISVTTEHRAVLDPLARLARQGWEIQLLTPLQYDNPRCGWVDPEQVAEAIRDETLFVSIMMANNEVGVIQSIAEIGAICKAHGVLLHCDATQAVGRLPVDVESLKVDLLSFTAHKIYGPLGIGGLYVRRRDPRVRLAPLIEGGGQERGLRSGTLNVPGIAGMAHAMQLCEQERLAETERLRRLRNRLAARLLEIPDAALNGPLLEPSEWRLAGNLNLRFADVDGQSLMLGMGDLAVSSGSACTSANPQPSHVLRALGLDQDLTRSSLRFGLGRFNTEEEVDRAITIVTDAVGRLRTTFGA